MRNASSDHHENHRPFRRKKESSTRAFGFVMSAFFSLLGAHPLLTGGRFRFWACMVAFAFAAVATLRPSTLAPLSRGWLKLGYLMQRVVSPVVMAGLYFALFTPVALLLRAFGKDPMRRKRLPAGSSYWEGSEETDRWRGDLRRQF